MLGPFTKDEMDAAKKTIEGLKATKMAIVAHKHLDDPLNFIDVFNHLRSEVREVMDAHLALILSNSSFENAVAPSVIEQLKNDVLLELADVSGACDILAMILLRGKKP